MSYVLCVRCINRPYEIHVIQMLRLLMFSYRYWEYSAYLNTQPNTGTLLGESIASQ